MTFNNATQHVANFSHFVSTFTTLINTSTKKPHSQKKKKTKKPNGSFGLNI